MNRTERLLDSFGDRIEALESQVSDLRDRLEQNCLRQLWSHTQKHCIADHLEPEIQSCYVLFEKYNFLDELVDPGRCYITKSNEDKICPQCSSVFKLIREFYDSKPSDKTTIKNLDDVVDLLISS